MSPENIYVSKKKLAELKKELEFLKTEKRKEIAEKLEYAKSLGDLSENAEYQEERENQANIEGRILELEALIQHAKIVKEHHGDTVEVGSTIVVKKEGDTEKTTYYLVGSEETDMSSGKISNISPLGEALCGKKKGDTATFQSPGGEVQYKIIDVK